MPEKRYPDLPPTTRALLESLTPQQVVEIMEVLAFYQTLPTSSREFLQRSRKQTLDWLRDARPEEIAQLNEGIQLVQSLRTVGRVLKWATIGLIATFVAFSQLADQFAKIGHWIRGGR